MEINITKKFNIFFSKSQIPTPCLRVLHKEFMQNLMILKQDKYKKILNQLIATSDQFSFIFTFKTILFISLLLNCIHIWQLPFNVYFFLQCFFANISKKVFSKC